MKYRLLLFVVLMASMLSVQAQTVVEMEQSKGVYYVPCKVNGLSMKFILDTGASVVCISQTTANTLRGKGLLSEADYLGKSKSTIADGRPSL